MSNSQRLDGWINKHIVWTPDNAYMESFIWWAPTISSFLVMKHSTFDSKIASMLAMIHNQNDKSTICLICSKIILSNANNMGGGRQRGAISLSVREFSNWSWWGYFFKVAKYIKTCSFAKCGQSKSGERKPVFAPRFARVWPGAWKCISHINPRHAQPFLKEEKCVIFRGGKMCAIFVGGKRLKFEAKRNPQNKIVVTKITAYSHLHRKNHDICALLSNKYYNTCIHMSRKA